MSRPTVTGVARLACLALALLGGASAPSAGKPATGPRAAPGPDAERVEQLLVEKTNRFRRDQGLEAVRPESALGEAARNFAGYMARSDDYGHTADGREPVERAREQGYDHCLVLENLAYVFSTRPFTTAELAERFVEGWKESPGHRENMLEAAATETGVAVARSDRSGRWYAVQMFGRPMSESVRFQVRNTASATVRYRVGKDEFSLAPRTTNTHTQCRSAPIGLAGARAAGDGAGLATGNGDRFAIFRARDGLSLRRE